MTIQKPLLLGAWRNTYGVLLDCCVATTEDGGGVLESETIQLSLSLNRDYWFSGDGTIDSPAGNGDLITMMCDEIVAQLSATVSAIAISFNASGHLVLTPTLIGGATKLQIYFVADTSGPTALEWNRLFGFADDTVARDTTDGPGFLPFEQLSATAFYVGKPFHVDTEDRPEWIGGATHSVNGLAWPSGSTRNVGRREIGWDWLGLAKVLEAYADEAEPWNTSQNFCARVVKNGYRMRVYPGLEDLGTDEFKSYTPRNPLKDPVKQLESENQLYHEFRLPMTVDAADEAGGPPVIESFLIGGLEEIEDTEGAIYDFTWVVTGFGVSLEIDQGVGVVSGGSEPGWAIPVGETVYTLTATNAFGEATAQVATTGIRFALAPRSAGWTRSFRSVDATETEWASVEAGFDDLVPVSNPATLGVSTAGINTFAIGGIEDSGVSPSTASSGQAYHDTDTGGNGFPHPDSCFRLLVLVKPATLTNGRYLWEYRVSGTERYQLDVNSGELRVQTTRNGVTTSAACVDALNDGAWSLLEIVYDQAGGTGGEARLIVRSNGVEIVNDATFGSDVWTGFDGTNQEVGIFGRAQLGTDTLTGVYVFLAVEELTAYTDATLADHQLDAEALGLYTP